MAAPRTATTSTWPQTGTTQEPQLHRRAARGRRGRPVSQREISDRLSLDPSDLVTLVDILERAGMVTRQRDPADRRRYALDLTPEGRRAVARLAEVAREAGELVLAPLDDTERRQLGELLTRVVSHHAGRGAPAAPAPPPAGS